MSFKNISNDKYILLVDGVKVLGSDFAAIDDNTNPTLSVYPNPTADIITVSGFTAGDQLILMTLTGEELAQSSSASIDLSQYATGTYILAVKNQAGTTYHKVIKE